MGEGSGRGCNRPVGGGGGGLCFVVRCLIFVVVLFCFCCFLCLIFGLFV